MGERTPVTVLTGFLGAGKTTLVNRILSEQHGKRIAVIENEFGEIGVDQALVIGADEEIFETSNGCVCCTVRGDLIRILRQLRRRRDPFDAILVETTGLADPGPVAQTFFVDEELSENYLLDAIVTLVDARHIEQQLALAPVALEQIGFADVLVLNKIDLVSPMSLAHIEQRLRAINATAVVLHAQAAQVPLERVLGLGAFDLTRALAHDGAFLDPPRPFEWAGVFRLAATRHQLRAAAPRDADGPSLQHVDVLLLPTWSAGPEGSAGPQGIESLIAPAVGLFQTEPLDAASGSVLAAGRLYRLQLAHAARFEVQPGQAGDWALFTQHAPDEFGLQIMPVSDAGALVPLEARSFASHHHELDVGSIGLLESRPLAAAKVNDWLARLLQSQGQDILRMKGVLSFKDEPRRYVFHGVHMSFDGQLERAWRVDEARCSRLVFIGRHLHRGELEASLAGCVA